MEYEKSDKKKIIGIVIAVLAALAAVGAVFAYVYLSPLFRLKRTVSTLMEENYRFSLDYRMQSRDRGDAEGTAEGEKVKDTIRGSVFREGKECLEVYANQAGDCVINVRPAFELLLEKLRENKLFAITGVLDLKLPDTYVSLEQLGALAEESGVRVMKAEERPVKAEKYRIKRIAAPKELSGKYKKAYDFFRVSVQGKEGTLVIGIPKKGGRTLYAKAVRKEGTLTVQAVYEPEKGKIIEMPQTDIDEETFELLKNIYALWLKVNKEK